MEMHKVMVAWFVWGFWAKVAATVLLIVCAVISFMGSKVGSICGAITVGLYVTNGLIWLIFGAIWRFSNAGLIASGDKLERLFNISDD